MHIGLFDRSSLSYKAEAAQLLVDCFPQAYADNAAEEIEGILGDKRVALMATDNAHLIGLVGAIPQYGMTGWELHPLAVRKDHRLQGIGAQLVFALEREVAERGGITLYLGSDDEFGKTTLAGADLYERTFEKIATIRNIGGHPYEFYQKIGYVIVGVIPDANGCGKPDIWMAKRIGRP